MSKKDFTPEQLRAAETRGGTVLVSAAAGSGKTTVLVERVIGMLTDPESPVSADRLLIVTFMKDAAAEMRERLNRALAERLEAEPDNIRLRRQKLLLQKATIGTMHSFCNSCLKEFFVPAGLSPDFRVADPAEMKMIRGEVLSGLLEDAFAEPDDGFTALIDLLSDERGSGALNDMIIRLDGFVSAFPEPEDKLRELADMYLFDGEPEDTLWGRYLMDYCRDYLRYASRCAERALERMSAYSETYEKYSADFEADIERIHAFSASLEKDWDSAYKALHTGKLFSDLTGKVKDGTEGKAEAVAARKKYKADVEKAAAVLSVTADEFKEDMRRLYPAINKLCSLTLAFRTGVAERKADRRILEYDDLEHLTAKLLVRKTARGYERTAVACELGERYDEILLDEYQDTNYTQDLIFRAISKERSSIIGDGTNMFMVGDIKQSIYRFRKAVPKLFLDRLNSYAPFNEEKTVFPLKITLGKNFRSRSEVTDSVNFFFSQLMTPARGGILYDSDEQRLFCGRTDFPPAEGMQTELHLIDGSKPADGGRSEDETRDIIEARYCARLIDQMIKEGFQVSDKKKLRPAGYGDFCIMRRSIKGGHGDAFVSQLSAFGIPVSISTDSGFFRAPEICIMLSLLRAVDNPLLDISLLAALRSPIFGFDCDRIAELRSSGEKRSVYADLSAAAAQGQQDCIDALELLSRLRDMAAAMPSDRLIAAIFRRTGFLAAVQAMDNGAARKANLLMLLDKARAFESSGFKGLARFINALDRLIEHGEDFACASITHEDCVTVRTMHKAKGLEFPICLIAGLGSEQNDPSRDGSILLHNDLGIGMKVRDKERRIIYTTAQREAAKLANRLDDTDEELRILYVALTRPVDKMIMISTSDARSSFEKNIIAVGNMIFGSEIDPFALTLSPSLGKWLTAAAMRHPSGGELREIAGLSDDIVIDTDVPLEIRLIGQQDEMLAPQEPAPARERGELEVIPETAELIRGRLDYRYPYAQLHSVPSKVTASGTHAARQISVSAARPSFMQDKGLSAAEKGTALHKFMQFCDFSLAGKSPEDEAERLVSTGHISAQEAKAVDLGKIRAFFSGDMGALLAETERMEREWRFTALLEPRFMHYFTEDDPCGEPVVLEGECDLLLFTKDGAVIVDYKTDRVTSPDALTERYAPQLTLYASAVRQVTGITNVSCRIYSFALSELITVECEN